MAGYVAGGEVNTLADCPRCVETLASNPHIIGAAASVGIEHGKTTAEAVHEYMLGRHLREGHTAAGASAS